MGADDKGKDTSATMRAALPHYELKRDLKKLDRKAPADDAGTPHAARLAPFQILEIERMASQGMNLDTIAARLGIPMELWEVLIRVNPEVAQAYRTGAARGVDWISSAALVNARAGDAAMQKYYLDRFGGPQFRPAQQPAVVIQAMPMAQIDQEDMARRFARQRALIDGTCEELDQVTERPA